VRIGFDGTPLLGRKTGIGWYTHDLVHAVAHQAPDDQLIVFPISWRTARTLRLDRPQPANVAVRRRVAPARPLWAMWDRLPFPPVEWLVDCDVFHATNYIAPPSRRVPTVVTVHDIGFIHRPTGVNADVARMARLLPTVLRRAAAVITVSEFTRQELLDWLPELAERTTVVPNGSHRRAAPEANAAVVSGILPGPPFALVLGTLEPRKNVVFALDALAQLRRRGVELRLVLAGASSPLLDVGRLLRERDLGPTDVVRTGYLTDGRVAALLAEARLLVFPSLYEGFGMPLLEAMEAGLPVVATRAGATPETVGDAAVLVEPGNVEGLAEAMTSVAFDDEHRATLVARGRARAADFTWERAAAASLAVYRQVTRAGAAS